MPPGSGVGPSSAPGLAEGQFEAVAPAKATCAVGDPVAALCGVPPLPLLLAVAPGVCPGPRPGLRRPFPGVGLGLCQTAQGRTSHPAAPRMLQEAPSCGDAGLC